MTARHLDLNEPQNATIWMNLKMRPQVKERDSEPPRCSNPLHEVSRERGSADDHGSGLAGDREPELELEADGSEGLWGQWKCPETTVVMLMQL